MSPLTSSTDFTVNNSAYFVSTISSVLRRRVAVYQRSHRRRCRGSSTETGERPKPCGPLDTKHLLRLRTFWTSYWDPHTLSITDQFTNNRKAQPSEARFLLLLPLHGKFRRAGSCYFTIQTLDLETLRGRHHSYRPTLWDKHLLPGLSDWESLLFVVETHAHLIRCYRLYSTHSTVVASVAQCLQRLSWDRGVVRSNPARASDFFQHFCSVFRRHIRVDLFDDEYLVRNMPCDAFSMLAL